MKELKKEKLFWKRYFGYDGDLNLIDKKIDHINLRSTEIGDQEIGWLVSRLEEIEMLDMDETNISNEAIANLTQLGSIKELRLKDNFELTDDCIGDLNNIPSLQLLHLGSTSITLEGLKKLQLKNLQHLLFSFDGEVDLSSMLILKENMPACRFIINHQVFSFDERN